jgi:hypothetical protein
MPSLQRFWTAKLMSEIDHKMTFEDISSMSFDTSLVNAMYAPSINDIWDGICQH